MVVRIEIHPDYAGLYGIDAVSLPEPLAGEDFRSYIKRSGLGKEEDILLVVGGASKPFSYVFRDGDTVKIYPMAASG